MGDERQYRTRGIVLRRRDFDEADRLLTVLTRDRGKLTLLAKGARKISSRKAAHVDLFKQVELCRYTGGEASASSLRRRRYAASL